MPESLDPALKEILGEVCQHLSLRPAFVCKSGKGSRKAYAKQLYFYLSETLTDHTRKEIAAPFRCTKNNVNYGKKTIAHLIQVDEKVKADVLSLKRRMGAA